MKTSFKTKTTTKKAIAMAMAVTMMFGTIAMPSMFNTSDFLSISASAASGVNSLPTNIKCYPLSTSNNTPAYNSPGATSKSGTIYAADLCTIRAIYSNGYMTVEYPTSKNKTKTLYCKISAFFNSSTYEIASISKYSAAYRRSSGNATIGSVDNRDTKVYVLGGVVNGRYQIIYRVGSSSTYKLGWVPSSVVKFASNQNNTKTKLSYGLYKNNSARVTCGFDGYRNTSGRHEGIDVSLGVGKPIYSLTDGVVTRVAYGYRGSKGLSTIAIYYAAQNKTVIYLHSAPLSSLKAGQTIKKGQQIGTQDWRGVSSASGSHTHVEVRNGRQTYAAKSVGDSRLDNQNPTSFWNSIGYTIG